MVKVKKLHVFVAAITFVWLAPAEILASGIVAHLPSEAVVHEIDALGSEWVRIDFIWALVEIEQDVFDWQVYDALIDRLEERDLRIFATLHGTPEWASSGPLFSGAPDDPRDWRDFCFRAADRYRGRVQAWGLWNEANLDRFWHGTRSAYIEQILVGGAEALRAADPRALICGPELAHLSSAHWYIWLAEGIRAAGHLLDVLTHHAYSSEGRASDVTEKLDEDPQWPWEPPSLRTVLEVEGWGNRPVWLSESGLESDDFGEPAQADFYVELLDDWFDQSGSRRWIDRIFFYEMVDDPGFPEITFGVLGPPPLFRRKQAFDAYAGWIAAAAIDSACLERAEVCTFVLPGSTQDLVLTLQNNGTTTWTAEHYRLEPEIVGGHGWKISGGEIEAGTTLPPGATVAFVLTLGVPGADPDAGTSTVQLRARMRRGESSYFGDSLVRTVVSSTAAPAEVLVPPRSRTVREGSATTLSFLASSSSPVTFQWRRNSIVLNDGEQYQGSQSPVLRINGVTRHTEGCYDCVLSNLAGSIISPQAVVSLGDAEGYYLPARRSTGRLAGGPTLLEAWRAFRARDPISLER